MGVVGKCANVSIVLSASEGRGFISPPARVVFCPAAPSSIGLPCDGDWFEAPLLDIFDRLGVLSSLG